MPPGHFLQAPQVPPPLQCLQELQFLQTVQLDEPVQEAKPSAPPQHDSARRCNLMIDTVPASAANEINIGNSFDIMLDIPPHLRISIAFASRMPPGHFF